MPQDRHPTSKEIERWTSEGMITAVLTKTKSIAVFGLSTDPDKDSHRVAAYLKRAGYKIIPIHPKASEILEESCFKSLADAPHADLVDCFRPSEELAGIVVQAIAAKSGAVWFQLGLMDAGAARRAEAAGLTVIVDRCVKVEHAQRIGPRE